MKKVHDFLKCFTNLFIYHPLLSFVIFTRVFRSFFPTNNQHFLSKQKRRRRQTLPTFNCIFSVIFFSIFSAKKLRKGASSLFFFLRDSTFSFSKWHHIDRYIRKFFFEKKHKIFKHWLQIYFKNFQGFSSHETHFSSPIFFHCSRHFQNPKKSSIYTFRLYSEWYTFNKKSFWD